MTDWLKPEFPAFNEPLDVGGMTFIRMPTNCPEQYEIYITGRLVGYVRARYDYAELFCPADAWDSLCWFPTHDNVSGFDDFERFTFLGVFAEIVKMQLNAHPEKWEFVH